MRRGMTITAAGLIAASAALVAVYAEVSDDVAQRFDTGEVRYTGGQYENHAFEYRLLRPANVEAGKRYPVVLFLHGSGERGADNVKNLEHMPTWMSEPEQREKFPCYLIVPQCPLRGMWTQGVRPTSRPSIWTDEPSHETRAVMRILDKVLEEEAAHVDVDRVYLTGLSMGGYGTWDIACRWPERFAAAGPICGGGSPEQAGKLVGLPLWAWHGSADNAVPAARSREMIEAIKQAGGEPKYTELEGVGHNSWNAAYRSPDGLTPWLFEQRRGGERKAQ